MTKQEINTKLKELFDAEMSAEVNNEAKELLANYQSVLAADHKEQLEKYLAEGGEKEDFAPRKDDEDATFSDLWTKYTQKKTSWEKEKAEAENRNLDKKKSIIEQIESLASEENIKQAMTRMKELEEEWKEIGHVASSQYRDLQHNYSRVRDEFFYNMRIYRELLEHDLKRNLQLKEELAEKMEALLEKDKIKEVEDLIRSLSAEWDEVGPTFHDKWEAVRDRFKNAQRTAYDKLKEHYQGVKEQLQENLEKKEALCKRLEEMQDQEITTEKRWRKLTDEVIAIQKEWKTIGYVPRKENEAIWTRFKSAGDAFFNRKSDFYAELKQEQDKHKDAKKKLVDEAEALKDSEDWKTTGDKLIKLQKRWKQIGPAHQRDEQRLWKQFRAACNHFFEKKKEFFSTKDERQVENLAAKKAIVEKISSLTVGDDANATIKELDQLVNEFASIGFVPIEDKNKINNEFKNTLSKKYKEVGLDEDATDKLLYLAKVKELGDTNSGATDSKAIQREEKQLRDKISKLKHTIIQYENNLGFFANSKGANKLKEEVEQKIADSKAQIDELKGKLRLLRNSKDGEVENPYIVEETEAAATDDSNTEESKTEE